MTQEIIVKDLQTLAITSGILDLYQIIITEDSDGTPVKSVYFHGGKDSSFGNITFRDFFSSTDGSGTTSYHIKTYNSLPISCSGIGVSPSTSPRPVLSIANVSNLFISTLNTVTGLSTYRAKDLIGAKVVIRKTQEQYLSSGSTTTPPAEFPRQVYIIDRIASETEISIQYELSSPFDLEKIDLPRRVIEGKYCTWRYRGYYGDTYPSGSQTIATGTTPKAKVGGCTWRPAFRNYAFPSGINFSASNFVKSEYRPYFTINDNPLVLLDYLTTNSSVYTTGGTAHFGAAWDSATTYNLTSYVASSGKFYLSKLETNLNNNPATFGDIDLNPHWTRVYTYTVWNDDTTGSKSYGVGDFVEHNFTVWECEIAHTKSAALDYIPSDSSLLWTRGDGCGKTLNSCKIRFGAKSAAPAQTYHIGIDNNDGSIITSGGSNSTFTADGNLIANEPFYLKTSTTISSLIGRPDNLNYALDSSNWVFNTTTAATGTVASNANVSTNMDSWEHGPVRIYKSDIIRDYTSVGTVTTDLVGVLVGNVNVFAELPASPIPSTNAGNNSTDVLLITKRQQNNATYAISRQIVLQRFATVGDRRWRRNAPSDDSQAFRARYGTNHENLQSISAEEQQYEQWKSSDFVFDPSWKTNKTNSGSTDIVGYYITFKLPYRSSILPSGSRGETKVQGSVIRLDSSLENVADPIPQNIDALVYTTFNMFNAQQMQSINYIGNVFTNDNMRSRPATNTKVKSVCITDHGYANISLFTSVFSYRQVTNTAHTTFTTRTCFVLARYSENSTGTGTGSNTPFQHRLLHVESGSGSSNPNPAPCRFTLLYLGNGHHAYIYGNSNTANEYRLMFFRVTITASQALHSFDFRHFNNLSDTSTPYTDQNIQVIFDDTATSTNPTDGETLQNDTSTAEERFVQGSSAKTNINETAPSAAYDPDGQRLLIYNGFGSFELLYLDTSGTTVTTVAKTSTSFGLPNGYLPDNTTNGNVIYNRKKSTFYFVLEHSSATTGVTKIFRLATFGTKIFRNTPFFIEENNISLHNQGTTHNEDYDGSPFTATYPHITTLNYNKNDGQGAVVSGDGSIFIPHKPNAANIKIATYTNTASYNSDHTNFKGFTLENVNSASTTTNYVIGPATYSNATGLSANVNYFIHDTGEINTIQSGPNKTLVGLSSTTTSIALGDPSAQSSFTGVSDITAATGKGGASAVSSEIDETVALPFGGFPGLDKFQ